MCKVVRIVICYAYHYYRRYWQPQVQQKFECAHEEDNPYYIFALEMIHITSGMAAGHLPMENSHATKLLLTRGLRLFATLTSTNYC